MWTVVLCTFCGKSLNEELLMPGDTKQYQYHAISSSCVLNVTYLYHITINCSCATFKAFIDVPDNPPVNVAI